VGEAASVAARALALLERVAGSGRLVVAAGCGVGIVAEAAAIAARALALLERVARARSPLGSATAAATAAAVVAEAAAVATRALALLECIAHRCATATTAAESTTTTTAAALAVREPARIAAGALALLEGVAHRGGARTARLLAEARLLRVLALGAARGLVVPPLALVELLLARRELELGVAVAAVQGDVLALWLGQAAGVARRLGVHLELWRGESRGGARGKVQRMRVTRWHRLGKVLNSARCNLVQVFFCWSAWEVSPFGVLHS